MANNALHLVLVTLIFCLEGAYAGDWCTTKGTWLTFDSTYCSYGCCGAYPKEYCCSADVGFIVGCVMGTLAFICVLAALFCCCCAKRSRPVTRIVRTTVPSRARSGVTVLCTGTSGQYPASFEGYPSQPVEPPPYSSLEPAIPPPPYEPGYQPGAAPPPPGFTPSVFGSSPK